MGEATEEPVLRIDAERAAWREVGDELVVLDLEDSKYLSVAPTGARIWSLLETGATRGQLIATILAEYDVDRPTVEADVDGFLAGLRERGLLLG